MSGPMKFWCSLIVGVAALIWGLRALGSGDASGPSLTEQPGLENDVVEPVARPPAGKTTAQQGVRASGSEGDTAEAMDGIHRESLADVVPGAGLTTVQEVASEIGGQAPALVIFFSTECPRSRGMFPSFVALTEGLADDTAVMAYSTLEADAARLPEFLSLFGASFGATAIQRWAPGELDEAMQDVGIRIGQEFALPLLAVVGEGGAVLGQWQGVTDLTAVRRALGSGGMLE